MVYKPQALCKYPPLGILANKSWVRDRMTPGHVDEPMPTTPSHSWANSFILTPFLHIKTPKKPNFYPHPLQMAKNRKKPTYYLYAKSKGRSYSQTKRENPLLHNLRHRTNSQKKHYFNPPFPRTWLSLHLSQQPSNQMPPVPTALIASDSFRRL